MNLSLTICPPEKTIFYGFQIGVDLKEKFVFRIYLPFLIETINVQGVHEKEPSMLFAKGFKPSWVKVVDEGVAGTTFETDERVFPVMDALHEKTVTPEEWKTLAGYFFYDLGKKIDMGNRNRIPLGNVDEGVSVHIGNILKRLLEENGFTVKSVKLAKKKDVYKAGMNLELQKFGTPEKQIQEVGEIEVHGLNNLSIREEKAMSALQILMDRRDYQSDIDGDSRFIDSFGFETKIPSLITTYNEFFEAYGLNKISGRYQGKQRNEAIKALLSLTQPRQIIYERKYKNAKGQKRSKMIRITKSLLGIIEGLDVSQNKARKVREGEVVNTRTTILKLELSPLFVDQIRTFYCLKPIHLHKQIETVTGPKRQKQCYSKFINWLVTKNTETVKIKSENLAAKIGLESMVASRKHQILNDTLNETFGIAKKLDFLKSARNRDGVFHFRLNPEKCRRIPGKIIDVEPLKAVETK